MKISINTEEKYNRIMIDQLKRYNNGTKKNLDPDTYAEMVFIKGLIGMNEEMRTIEELREAFLKNKLIRKLEDGSLVEFS